MRLAVRLDASQRRFLEIQGRINLDKKSSENDFQRIFCYLNIPIGSGCLTNNSETNAVSIKDESSNLHL